MKPWMASLAALAIVACAPARPGSLGPAGPVASSQPRGTSVVRVALTWPDGLAPDRRAQILDSGAIVAGAVSVSGPGMATPLTATISLEAGAAGSLDLAIPDGANRVIEVKGLGPDGKIVSPFAVVRGIASVPADARVVVNADTTPAANVFLELRAAGSIIESSLDRREVVRAIAAFLREGPAGKPDSPALVDSRRIAADLIASAGQFPTLDARHAIPPAALIGHVDGLVLGQVATVRADDPGSPPVLTDESGNFRLASVVPGTALTLDVRSPFYTALRSLVPAILPGATGTVDVALGGNYITRWLFPAGCAIKNPVARWTQLPIRLLILTPTGDREASASFDPQHARAVDEAVATLEAAMPEVLKFEVSRVADNASDLAARIRRSDIYVVWRPQLLTGCGKPTVGCFSPFPDRRVFDACETGAVLKNRTYQGKILLATHHQLDGKLLDYRSLRRIALHELIHAMGLNHSPDTTDVMYESTLSFFAHNVTLSERDLNTLRFLYSLPANYTRDHAAFDQVPAGQNDGSTF